LPLESEGAYDICSLENVIMLDSVVVDLVEEDCGLLGSIWSECAERTVDI